MRMTIKKLHRIGISIEIPTQSHFEEKSILKQLLTKKKKFSFTPAIPFSRFLFFLIVFIFPFLCEYTSYIIYLTKNQKKKLRKHFESIYICCRQRYGSQ